MRGLQILLVLAVAYVCVDIASATGGKKKVCEEPCGYGAVCDRKTGECKCRSKRLGNPDFMCYNPKYFYQCQIASDPVLKPYNEEDVSGIKIPAALSMTNVTTKRFGPGRGTCEIKLNGWSKRFEGKYFVKGLQLTLNQEKKNGVRSQCKFRVVAKVVDKQYTWEILKKDTPNNNWEQVAVIDSKSKDSLKIRENDCEIRFQRLKSNFLYTNVMCCVFRFAIRPHNIDKPDVIPGVYLQLRKSIVKNILGHPDYLCGSTSEKPEIDNLKDEYGMKSRTQYTTFTGLGWGRPLNYPFAYPGLKVLQDTLTACDKNKAGAFMTKCEFLFNYARLISCFKDDINKLTHQIAKGFCNNDAASCDAAMTTLATQCQEVKPNKQMKAFMKNGCV